ncbi:vacuolar import and degradation protein [Planoprotostelium fungivorum]|uniref:Vacuolar import and degradation protein n=1 Tax=Planoprotostelium fungivorum TaxID=1890364 RepID=A0A2P6N550_9EUKA|nr:vacuolar import and degradation protein [Planoprotostelium fungivorum]
MAGFLRGLKTALLGSYPEKLYSVEDATLSLPTPGHTILIFEECSIEIQRTAEFKSIIKVTGFPPGEEEEEEYIFDVSDTLGFLVEFDDGEKQNGEKQSGHEFEVALCKAIYESRYQASSAGVSTEDLSQFIETNEEPPKRTPAKGTPSKAPSTPAKAMDTPVKTVTPMASEKKITTPIITPITPSKGSSTPTSTTPFKSPMGTGSVGSVRPNPRVKYGSNYPVLDGASDDEEMVVLSPKSQLYQFDEQERGYVLRDDVKCSLVSLGDGKKSFIYDLVIHRLSDDKLLLRIRINSDLNMTFHHKEGSVVWTERIGEVTWPWSLAFDSSTEEFYTFESAYKEALWETNSQKPYSSLKAEDQKYVVFEPEEEEEEEESESEVEVEDEFDRLGFGESEPEKVRVTRAMEEPTEGISASRNQLLTVGGKNDRTFVSRGSRIGVFKNDENDVEFVSTIDRLKTPDGKYFSPKRMMLHKEEKSMLFLPGEVKGSTPSNKVVYKMDLERPDIVEEWNLGDHPVQELFHQTKFGEMKDQDGITGLNLTGFVHIDPRTQDKVVNSQYYSATTKPALSCAATTKTGDLVAGSKKGEIRMYSAKTFQSSAGAPRAKTNLPGFGDPILSIETTEDGEWILATCKNYLVVIRSENNGINGFQKPLGKDKPAPKRLQLSQADIVNMGGQISFTPAKFNGGAGQEKAIVTSTGPYVVTWNFSKIKKGIYDAYDVKEYSEDVIGDQFKYRSDKSIVVATDNDVSMASRNRPVREFGDRRRGLITLNFTIDVTDHTQPIRSHFTKHTMISRRVATRFIVVEALVILLLARLYVLYLDSQTDTEKATLFERLKSGPQVHVPSIREQLSRAIVDYELLILLGSGALFLSSFYPRIGKPGTPPRSPKEKTFSWALSHPSPSSRRVDSPKLFSKQTRKGGNNYAKSLEDSTLSLLKEAKRNQFNMKKSVDNSWMDKADL